MDQYEGKWQTVKVDVDPEGIAWVILNRPQKRNAMSPTLNREMALVLEALELMRRRRFLCHRRRRILVGRDGPEGILPRGGWAAGECQEKSGEKPLTGNGNCCACTPNRPSRW